MSAGGDGVVRRIATFGQVLRAHGLEVGTGRVLAAVQALDAIELGRRDQLYWALRCTLVARREQIAMFDAAFDAFWDGESLVPLESRQRARSAHDDGATTAETPFESRRVLADEQPEESADPADRSRSTSSSAVERLAELDFACYGEDELRQAREIVTRIARSLPVRRSLRQRPAPAGRRLDERQTLRGALRTEGHPIERRWREPNIVARKLVFLLDVSGSMEPYARASVMFLQAAVRASRRVEALTFGTRLTRLTPHLALRDPAHALAHAARAVPDWAGGTRIGENLKAFNDVYGRRGLSRGAVVVIVSDGWERGEVGLLRTEMERLARTAHHVVWVNPVAGDPDYAPIAAGMAAALPAIDIFLPGHNLRSLQGLADALGRIGARRPARPRDVGAPV